jgi:hypothetical protein
MRRGREENMILAWHIEAMARQKKMPKLEDMIKPTRTKNRDMTPEQIEATVRGWLGRNRKGS